MTDEETAELAYYRKVYANRRHDWGWKTNPYHDNAETEVEEAEKAIREWKAARP